MKPIVYDLFCGLGGWSEAFIESGYRAIGFDIEAHDYGNGGYPGELVLRDIRSITGAELVQTYGVPAVIVASPPCQEFSYMAMPWSKAKEKMRKILADPAEQKRLCELFNTCFRIQREVSAAAGHYVPLIIENVRGAQRWVGKARWNFGSFYLWGDVPALMPIPGKAKHKTTGPATSSQVENHNCHINEMRDALKASDHNLSKGGAKWRPANALGYERPEPALKGDGLKLPGNNSARRWEDREVQRLCDAGVKRASEQGRRTDVGNGARFTSRDCGNEATKSGHCFGDGGSYSPMAMMGSKSSARKRASAEIAKIPRPLALWIAKCFKPVTKP